MITLFSNIKAHWSHYLVLVIILLFGGLSFAFFGKFPQARVVSVFLTAVFYVVWGIMHHYLEGDLHIKIILEYVAVALLGFLIIWTQLNRA